jgi:AhpD family alkylhydroperoxidase
MKTRFNMEKLEPNAYASMLALEGCVRKTPLKAAYKELIKIRASQINSCAYCIEMHAADARKHGETESRIYALNAWRESPLFSDEERALLTMTEEVTLLANKGLTDEAYSELQKHFDDLTIAQAIMQVVTINAWNRITVSSRMMHAYQLKAEAEAVV